MGLHRYHVRIGTWDRQRHFSVGPTTLLAIEHLLRLAHVHEFAVNTYCFMPDHVHVLTCGSSDASHLPSFVGRWKQATAFAFARGNGGRLWQPGYFERVLRQEESDGVVARYIVGNPVRAGLAYVVGEYPYAWSRWPID